MICRPRRSSALGDRASPPRRAAPGSSIRSERSIRAGPIAWRPTMRAASHVALWTSPPTPVVFWLVEHVLGGHRAEAPDQPGDLLAAPVREAVLDLHRLVVAARGAAAADRQPRGEPVLAVQVRADGVPGLVDRGRPRLVLRVGLVDRDAGLDRRHRLDDVGPLEDLSSLGVRVGERHRADLVDHRRRVAVGDARQLVALLRRVERRVVPDLVHVEVEDVAPVLPRGRAEVDVAAHAAGAHERRVERGQRHVAGADEVDLLLARPRRAHAQGELADPARNEVQGVEERVQAVRGEALHERRVVDAVHHDQQLVERQPAAAHAAHAAGDHEVVDRAGHPLVEGRVHRARRLGAQVEQVVAPLGWSRARGRRPASARPTRRSTAAARWR